MFVQVIQGQVADADELRASFDRWLRDLSPGSVGWRGSTAGVTEDGVAIVVARFESEESARRNSDRPEQTQWWMETAKLFAGDVTFHDCTEVHQFGAGGSDEAGFVQIMQGRYTDPPRAMELMRGSDEGLSRLRPDVIGGMLCMHGDGGFTTAVYFTSEAEARMGEKKEPPPDLKALMDEEMSITEDLRFFDLKEPLLYSRK
jgi:hypothetical protein